MFFQIIHSEFKKAKHSSTFWFTLAAAGLVPLVMFLVYLFRWEQFVTPENINPWTNYIERAFNSTAPFLFPAFIIMLIAMNAQLEHKNQSWKKLYLLPVNKSYIYSGKLTFLSLVILSALFIFSFLLIIFALVNGLLHPDLGFSSHFPDLVHVLQLIFRLFVASMGIISIQTFISMLSRNMILPLASGIFLLIASMILVIGWKGSIYNPYAFPIIFSNELSGFMKPDKILGISIPNLVSVLSYLCISIPANIFFSKRQISN